MIPDGTIAGSPIAGSSIAGSSIAGSSIAEGTHAPTRAVHDAVRASSAAVGLLVVLRLAALVSPSVDQHAAWSQAPFSPVVGAVAALAALVALPTWLRAAVHGGPVPAPPHAVRAMLIGTSASVACTTTAALACIAAVVVETPGTTWDGVTAGLLVALAALVGLTALAAHRHTEARGLWEARFAALEPSAALDAVRPDVLDDAAILAARWWPGSVAARTAAWAVRGLDVWTWSPRRHRRVFVAGVAGVTGLGWAAWHGLLVSGDGVPSGFVGLLDAAVTGSLVAAVLAAGITWLGLLRPVR